MLGVLPFIISVFDHRACIKMHAKLLEGFLIADFFKKMKALVHIKCIARGFFKKSECAYLCSVGLKSVF